jgi:hypothetical protein
MKTINELNGKNGAGEALRWGLIALAAALAAVLASTLETGRLHAQSASEFEFQVARVRVITPNGDRKNDVAILCFTNPGANAMRGEIFSLRGRKVADMEYLDSAGVGERAPSYDCPGTIAANPEAMLWDGKYGGAAVRSGVYIYVVKGEAKAFTGTILVVR